MSGVLGDLRYAARGLTRSPGFVAVAVLTLGLGIGANTAVFGVVRAVLLRPLPYPEPEGLVRVYSSWTNWPKTWLSGREFLHYGDDVRSFAGIGVWTDEAFNVGGGDEPERVSGAFVSPDLLPTLGVEPALGRAFAAADGLPGNEPAVLLGDGLWRRRFGGSPDVVGRRVRLDGEPHTVVGVLPSGFRLPDEFGAAEASQVLVPFVLDPAAVAADDDNSHYLNAVARLRPGVPFGVAEADLRASAKRLERARPDHYHAPMRFAPVAVPLGEDVLGRLRTALLVLLGAVGLVLLVACANVATLLLGRAQERAREFAVRASLGAERVRLVRLALAESLLLALAGGAAGAALAWWGTDALAALRPADLPRLDEVRVDLPVLGFALACALITGLLFGLVPAVAASRPDLARTLAEGGRADTGGPAGQRFRRVLVAGQVALAVVLVVEAGLLTRSLLRLQSVDLGFRPDHVLTLRLSLDAADYPEDLRVVGFFRELLPRLEALPDVRAAGAVSGLPLTGTRGDWGIDVEGVPEPGGLDSFAADWQVVTPGYFGALGMRVVRGRGIEAADDERAAGVVVVNRSMARRYWPGAEPIGRRIRFGDEPDWRTVVGVVDDVRHGGHAAEVRDEMYLPHAQFRFETESRTVALRSLSVALRTGGDPGAVAAAVRREIRTLDPGLPVGEVRTMDQVSNAALAQPRFVTSVLGSFSALALALALVGVYGVVAAMIVRRTREIAVRVAVGAAPRDVLALLLRQSLSTTALGVAIGLAAAAALGRVVAGLLFGVSPTDPATYAGLAVLLLAAALLASWIPARRALRLDPAAALRSE